MEKDLRVLVDNRLVAVATMHSAAAMANTILSCNKSDIDLREAKTFFHFAEDW